MSDKCDLCYKEETNLTLPASVLDGVENLEKMCPTCNDRLSAVLTEARKVVHKHINDVLVKEAADIRSENQ